MASKDIAPGLLDKIQKSFDSNLAGNKKASSLLEKIKAGNGTYTDAGNYAEAVGDSLSEALRSNLTMKNLPDGTMYWNIADRAIAPMYEQEYKLASDAATTVQNSLNKKANIGLKAKTAKLDEDSLDEILNMYCAAEYDDSIDQLMETAEYFGRHTVDQTLKENADFQYQCGRTPRIIRRAGAGCCEWCADVEGVYDYPNVPDDVYKRHDYCKCSVDYDPGSSNKNVQDVWSQNDWRSQEDIEKLEERKTYNTQRIYDTNGKKFKWDNGSRVETRKNGKTLAK